MAVDLFNNTKFPFLVDYTIHNHIFYLQEVLTFIQRIYLSVFTTSQNKS